MLTDFFKGSVAAAPIPQLSAMMTWTVKLPIGFMRFIGLVDIASGLGVLLPAATRVMPRLTIFAALGSTILQVLAAAFHALRGELDSSPSK